MGGHTCRYRAADGLKCAVGALIKDEHYTAEMEGRTCQHKIVLEGLAKSGINEDVLHGESHLLHHLQQLHDINGYSDWCVGAMGDSEFFNKIRVIAKRYNLTTENVLPQ